MEQTALDNLVLDNREDGVFRVHRSVFTEPQIMALEQRRVFEQCWLYAGHASEIPQPRGFSISSRGGAPGHPGAWQRWRDTRPAQHLHAPWGAGLP